VQGVFFLGDRDNLGVATGLAGLLALGGGAAIILGLLTPLAGSVVGLGIIALQLCQVPFPPGSLLNAAHPAFFVATVAISIVLLGPGALSIDARLFGRREIIVRHSARTGSGQ